MTTNEKINALKATEASLDLSIEMLKYLEVEDVLGRDSDWYVLKNILLYIRDEVKEGKKYLMEVEFEKRWDPEE